MARRGRPSKAERQCSRRADAVKQAMTATMNGSTLSGWLPVDVDTETASTVLSETVRGTRSEAHDRFARQLLSADRKRAGETGGTRSAQILPEALLPAIADAVAAANQSAPDRRSALRLVRRGIDEALPGLPDTAELRRFLVWYDGDNRRRNRKLIALIERSFFGAGEFSAWLEYFPTK